ncbi:hypothetical protein F442_11121 [Phytophthora nicotianae P10297]|uniref:PiggyBac transposable element-derived protein domain-containing protein n=1 Tax=Phytophthora nicotianae P10297 TaxID=1317064 RepID=W2Z3F2_PHYNI|nr:hypothetical protein F442_11121 [Phytophthora nicotianae P10297]
MENVVDFKVVWPLLRKEGWTWKPAKGLQIHANYLKPGCKLRGGKHGVDYFNGEDALLAHVKADKDLCTGLHLTNIMVRPNAVPLEPLPTSVSSVPSTSGKRQEPTIGKQPPKKLAKTVGSRKSEDKKSEKKQTPNTKKTKKQEAKEATERRRQLSSFANIWGAANAQDRDGREVEAPDQPPVQQEPHINADTEDNADENSPPPADMEDCADIHDDVESRSGDGSESEYEDDPNAAESEVDDEDDENSVAECDDREDDQGGEDTQGASLRHPGAVETHFEPLGFADAEPSDPNLVLGDIEKSIESDEEGEDSVGVADMLDTDDEVESLCEESVVVETSRIAGLLNEVELERLHMAVEGSSEVFDDNQLADMAARGWTVYPENEVADIVDDPEVDKVYEGYCGPSKDVLASAKSPLSLFLYFLPRAFGRHVARETHRYWEQTFDARLKKALVKETEVTHQPQKSRDKLRRKLERFERIAPHEIVQWIGLILAHTLNPRKSFEMHWSTAEDDLIPAGTFAKVMSRDRFRDITRFLHFLDNQEAAAARDRAWKIRPVLSTVEKTFKEGYVLGCSCQLMKKV